MPSYIPAADTDFNNWQQNFLNNLQTEAANLDITQEDLNALLTGQTAWESDYEAHLAAQSAAQSARQQKDDSRQAWENQLRAQVRKLQASETITNAQRAALGITVSDGSRAAIGAPTTRPLANIAATASLSHTVRFVDEATPTRRAKPNGVMGAEVWVAIGDAPPTNLDEMQFLGLDTRTPYVSEFDSEDIGKTAYYRLRWVNRRGEAGPWGDIISAAIVA